MNDPQKRVLSYLTADGASRDRTRAFEALAAKGWFSASGDADVARLLNEHLADNPTGACPDGIGRFRSAVDFPEEKKPNPVVRIVLDVGVDPAEYVAVNGSGEIFDGRGDQRVSNRVREHVRSLPWVSKASWAAYKAYASDPANRRSLTQVDI